MKTLKSTFIHNPSIEIDKCKLKTIKKKTTTMIKSNTQNTHTKSTSKSIQFK